MRLCLLRSPSTSAILSGARGPWAQRAAPPCGVMMQSLGLPGSGPTLSFALAQTGPSGSPRAEGALSSGAGGGKSCASAQALHPAQLRSVTLERRVPGTGGSPHLRALTRESTHTPPSRDKRRHSSSGRAAALLSVFTPPVRSLKPEACSQSLGQRRRRT